MPSAATLYAIHAALIALGLAMAAGLLWRASALAALALFAYVELLDVTNYLNHYYLVTLLLAWCALMPLGQIHGLDRRRRGPAAAKAWHYAALRAQLACVYFWAGIAKAQPDWLVDAQPLTIWLRARAATPILGPLFELDWVPLAMSWAGFLFDLTIWIWLLWRPTRRPAYLIALAFHATTSALFQIGIFPLVMCAAATIFFDPDWPRRLIPRLAPPPPSPMPAPRGRRALAALLLAALLIQWIIPARALLYGGDVLWHEQGMRWSWRVMVREKNGSITYIARVPDRARPIHIAPTRYLTRHQEREMSGQPDLIVQLAHAIGRDLEARYGAPVEVRVDALVSLNGRPARPIIDPDLDLMRVRDGLGRADWIEPETARP